MFVGYRIDRALQFGLPRAGVSTPPPLVSPFGFSPSSGGGIELPRHSSGDGWRVELRRFFITFAAAWFAPYRRGADLRGVLRAGAPAPRLCGSGGPRPFSPSPLPTVAPRRGRRGFASLRESGARYARGFFFGYRVGGGGGGWVRLTRPRVRVVRGAPEAAPPCRRVRCVRAPRPLGVRYATRQRPLGASAPPPPPPSRTRRSI